MRLPVDNHVITSHYGNRVLRGKEEFHAGLDFISREINKVYAISEGNVSYDMDNYKESLRWTDRKHSIGNFVIVDHTIDNKLYRVRYCHLADNLVYKGQKVLEGDTLGMYADVGYSFGAHLHIDMYDKDWKVLNIEEFFKEKELI